MPEMTQSGSPNKSKHRKKNRESHNEVERHRKKKINSGINRIGDLIPCSPALKQSKNMILDQAFKYITELKRQNDELLLNGGDKEQACEIKKLRRELTDIQKENARYIELLKSNDICLYDDPTLHWKGNARSLKASLIVPADQVQKLPLCLSSNQLGSANQGTAVHGITFNVGHNLQKQTANVVPVQRTCNLVTPITISGVFPLDKSWQQNSTSASTSSQHAALSLPVTTLAPSTADFIVCKDDQIVQLPSSSTSHISFLSSSAAPLNCSSNQLAQPENKVECSGRKHVDIVPKAAVSTCDKLPFHGSPSSVPGINLHGSPNLVQGKLPGVTACVETVKDVVKEMLPSVEISSSPGVAVTSGEINSSVEVQAGSAVSVLCAPSLEPSWSISSSLPELKSVGSLTRIPSDGTTQTTWSTLQLAGNTVQPLSLLSSAIVPSPLTEQSTASKDTLNSPQVTACINLNGVASSKVNPVEKVIVKMSSYQPVPVQSLITQPQLQSTTNILPLNPPVQVIQVAQPFGAAINSAPANQNIIFLQPPAPAPCPPVPKPAIGQQIVIIQTTPNQNPVPLMSAQPSSSVVMPINAANSTACPTNPVQNTMVPQTFSGKHLVHILPRPPSVQPSSNAQQVPVSAATSSQQPPTISLNGQLFALQPMTPSAGTSNQTPMQIIQPIASEDPNTNVALNTFGALANLSQNISQMAGQSCLQLTLNTPAATSLASNNMQVNCVSVAGSNVTPAMTETSSVLPIASVLAKSLSVKPIGGTPPSAKPKNTTKKSGVKKGASVRKDSTAITKSDSLCLDVPKPQSSDRNTRPIKSAAQEKMVASVDSSPKNGVSDKTQETSTSTALNASLVANLTESMPEEPLSADIVYGSRDLIADEVCITQEDEQRPPSSAPECFKASIESRAAPFNNQSVQHTLVVEVPQDQIGLSTDENSDTTMVSRSCLIEGDPASLIAADLLEVQVLTDEPYGKSPPEKATAKDLDRHGILSRKVKSKESVSSEEPKLNSSVVQVAQNQTSNSEQEVVNSSCVTSRQTDSPLSNSSVSSRNFSVASMLPDTSREDIVSGVSLVPPLNGCGFSEQNDIVAVAARAIFEQESLPKGRSRTQAEVGATVSRNVQSETLPADSPLPFKPHSAKENISQLSSTSDSFNTLDTKDHHCADRSVDKSNCPLGVNAASLSLQISTSQSQNMTSLSINNLLHQGGITHSVLNCASVLQTSEHIPLPTSTNPSVSSSAYESQTQVTTVLSEYSHEQLHSMNSTVMQVTQTTDSLLKQHADGRKESNKRAAHVDGLLSTAKRQKQCQAPIRLERLQTPDSVAEQNEMLVSHVSSDSSSISGNIQGHREGISNLFPTNNFVNSNLRQTDMRCGSQPSISEQGQMTNQHLQPLQQHQQQQLPLHNSNPYLKQQQSGHLRDQHHLYQQQHQVPHVDSSVRSQPHNIQQQRMMQHDVQMQKKRAPVQGAQVSRMTLQQKHLSEQHRQKSAQPHRQQIQQQLPPHFGSTQPEKTCDNNPPSRGLHGTHPQSHVGQDIRHQQEMNSRPQGPIVSSEHLSGHNQVQRLMTSRSLEQQMVSQSSVVSRPSNMTCAPHRQERNRVSSYSAEALIGKSTSNSEQRLGISIQASRVSEQLEMRNYLDISRNKVIPAHNIQGRMPVEHVVNMDSQRLPDCQTFKIGGLNHQQTANFEVQTSRNNDGGTSSSMRGLQSQTYRINQNPNSSMDRQKHLPYQTLQNVSIANSLTIPANENSCHQSFMQSLFPPHIGEQGSVNQRSISGHQRSQYNTSSSIEFSCPPARDALHLRRDGEGQNRESCDLVMGQVTSRSNSLNIPFSSSSSTGDIQGRNTSPHSSMQKSHSLRPADGQGAKNQLNIQVSINMHGVVHPPLPHQSVSHVNIDPRQTVRPANPPVAQRSRHPLQEEPDSKARQPERNRPGNQRHGNMFDSTLPHLPLAGPSSMILGRQQTVTEKRTGIVRFMPDNPQVSTDNPTPDQHTLTQNFGFPFMPEGTMNPPLNANASFIPPVTQTTATRTPALIPVDPQNTLPSFYPQYSPAHPSLSNDLAIPYFPNQIFPNPSTEKPNSTSLNNRFGSILSPPRPVGFSQTTFPLLPEMPPMHMANPSHLSNFNLTSLFPEIAAALPPDGSAMSPLLSISHSSSSDSSKTSNRPAHNISHILGHDSSSAV